MGREIRKIRNTDGNGCSLIVGWGTRRLTKGQEKVRNEGIQVIRKRWKRREECVCMVKLRRGNESVGERIYRKTKQNKELYHGSKGRR